MCDGDHDHVRIGHNGDQDINDSAKAACRFQAMVSSNIRMNTRTQVKTPGGRLNCSHPFQLGTNHYSAFTLESDVGLPLQ